MAEQDDDPAENIEDSLKERLKSPFYASWLIAFCAWNWRAIYYLLFPDSDLGLEQRLYEIDNTVYPHFWADHFPKLIAYPFLSACVAVSLIPWLLVILDIPRYRASIRLDGQRQRDDELRRKQKLHIHRLNESLAGYTIELENKASQMKQKDDEIATLNKKIEDAEVKARAELVNATVEAKKHVVPLLRRDANAKSFLVSLLKGRPANANNDILHALETSKLIENTEKGWVLTPDGKIIAELVRKTGA